MYQPWVAPFLANLKRTGNVSKSAALSSISSTTAYALKRGDADFAAAWDQALEDHIDDCEQELTRRAFGYEEPVVYQGQLTPVWERDEHGKPVQDAEGNPVQARNEDGSLKWLTVTKFSDTLLLAKVKAYRKRYSTERTELTGADGKPVMIDEGTRAARIAQLMAKAAARASGQADKAPASGQADFSDLA